MDLNKIKLLNKDELLKSLKESGYEEVANVLVDKDINGRTLMDLKEFEIFKWKLKPAQKNLLLRCIEEITKNPSILMTQLKPKLPRKSPSLVTRRPMMNNTEGLGNNQNKQRLTEISKPKNPEPSDIRINKGLVHNQSKQRLTEVSKPKSPEPFDIRIKKISAHINSNSKSITLESPDSGFKEKLKDHLSRIQPVDKFSTFPKIKKNENLSQLPVDDSKIFNNKPVPPLPFRNEGARSSENINRKAPAIIPEERMETEPVNRNLTGAIRRNPKPLPQDNAEEYLTMHAPRATELGYTSDDYLVPINRPQEFNVSPRLSKKNITSENNQKFQFDMNQKKSPSNTISKPFPEDTNNKTNKFLGDVIVVEGGVTQKEPLFSNVISKLNDFKNKLIPRNYENVDIQVEKRNKISFDIKFQQTNFSKENSVKNRPLPDIPSVTSKPFPPPRQIPSPTQDNYVELTSNFDDRGIRINGVTQTSASFDRRSQHYLNTQETEYPDNESEIYVNTASDSHQENVEEKMLVYENTTMQGVDEGDLIYENTNEEKISKPIFRRHMTNNAPLLSRHQNVEEEMELYGNTEAIRELEREDEELIYENTSEPTSSTHTHEQFPQSPSRINVNGLHQQGPTNRAPQDGRLNVPPNLATLLSEELMKRERKRGKVQYTNSDTDSEFGDEDDFPSHNDKDELPPIHKRPLPNIPIASNYTRSFPSDNNNSTHEKDKQTKPKNSVIEPSTSRPRNYVTYMVNDRGNDDQHLLHSSVDHRRQTNINHFLNLNNEPFYRETDRRGAKEMLLKLDNGAFLFRPSQTYFLVLSVKHENRIYNFGIERRENNVLRLNTEGDVEAPEFFSLAEFVSRFTEEPLTFGDKENLMEIYLRKLLPPY